MVKGDKTERCPFQISEIAPCSDHVVGGDRCLHPNRLNQRKRPRLYLHLSSSLLIPEFHICDDATIHCLPGELFQPRKTKIDGQEYVLRTDM